MRISASSFWIGLYGQSWVIGLEFCQDMIAELMRIPALAQRFRVFPKPPPAAAVAGDRCAGPLAEQSRKTGDRIGLLDWGRKFFITRRY